jgi:hypothetical protein
MNTAEHFPNAGIPTRDELHSFFEENLVHLLFQPISQIAKSFQLKISVKLESQKGKLTSSD